MSKGTPDIVFFLFTARLGGGVVKCEEGRHSQESSFLRGGFMCGDVMHVEEKIVFCGQPVLLHREREKEG